MGNHDLKSYPPAFHSTLLGVLVGPWVLRVAEIMFCVLAADILLMVDASLFIRTLLIFPFYVFAVSALQVVSPTPSAPARASASRIVSSCRVTPLLPVSGMVTR